LSAKAATVAKKPTRAALSPIIPIFRTSHPVSSCLSRCCDGSIWRAARCSHGRGQGNRRDPRLRTNP